METHGRDLGPQSVPRRITLPPSGDVREGQVRALHRQLDPTQAKGLRLTDSERTALLSRLHELEIEIVNAAVYEGVLA